MGISAMRHLTRLVALSLAFLNAPPALSAKAEKIPPPIFINHGTCPFECCTYRDWTTVSKVTLVDKPNGTKQIAAIPRGTVVRGVTGEVHARPLRSVATIDYTEAHIRKGSTFYFLHPVGEGFWAVWYRGKVVEIQPDLNPADPIWGTGHSTTAVWWAKIRLKNGVTGWTRQTDQFDNEDACG
jgi:hypothetical protein